MNEDKKYSLNISLNVLNHLGIKLYSNVPAVLSEIVSNAWDADADEVRIDFLDEKIVIKDNGHGMSIEDINKKYLYVGYDRRSNGESVTKNYKRPVMGRKGIGKLSLFSIAEEIKIETIKDGEKNAFSLNAKEIEAELIKEKERAGVYHPKVLSTDNFDFNHNGTKITLSKLKKNITEGTSNSLKKRISRRFSVLGAEYNFIVLVKGEEVKITDRDYFHKLEHIWYFGQESEKYAHLCLENKLGCREIRDNILNNDNGKYRVTGWIGTVESSGDLRDEDDNLNKIIVMVRGKLAQEDIMEEFPEGGMYTKYVVGEVHADFLDSDDNEDIATTSRQSIKKDDPRYKALKEFIGKELKYIQSKWTDLRNDQGTKKALENKAIEGWFLELKGDIRNKAKKLFGKINQLTIESEDERKTLFKHAVLAFETMRYRQNLDLLDNLDVNNIELFTQVFAEHNDIEATLYYQITESRVSVIKTLQQHVEDDALEKVVQKHLYDSLWLLDPSWDRATETPLMEQKVKKDFESLQENASQEEKEGRFDIKYKNTAGKHIIIELKRPGRAVSTSDLLSQVDKYIDALKKLLRQSGKANEPVEVVCLVGKELTDWKNNPEKIDESKKLLAVKNIRVTLYQELVENAYRMYKDYLDQSKETGKTFELIKSIENS